MEFEQLHSTAVTVVATGDDCLLPGGSSGVVGRGAMFAADVSAGRGVDAAELRVAGVDQQRQRHVQRCARRVRL